MPRRGALDRLKGQSINDVTHLGGSAKRGCYSISLFSKMGDKGKGGVKNLKKLGTSFMDGPKAKVFALV